jgi:hypothetical protein
MPFSLSSINKVITSRCSLIISWISIVEQFPLRNQITFGGNQKSETILLKSLSFVTIVRWFVLAYSHTKRSSDESSPRSCTCNESIKKVLKCLARNGDRFWSKRSFIRHKVQSFLYWPHSLNMPVYPPFEDLENQPVFLQSSFLRPDIQEHHRQSSVCPLYMACLHVFQVRWLFYLSAA